MSEAVALIGVGAMGRALLTRLRPAERRVQAFDVAAVAVDEARAAGAVAMPSPAAAAAGATFVHVIVSNDEQVLDVTCGGSGVLAAAAPGTVVLLHSTIMPETTKTVAVAGAAKGVHVLDAAVTGVPRRLAAGEATFLVGGPVEVVGIARPHLLGLGSAVYHFGPLGAGNVAKLAKNLYNASERVLLAEILNFAEAGGIDVRQFLEMQVATEGQSAIAEWEKNFTIRSGHAEPRPTTNLMGKDVSLAVSVSGMLGLDAPVTRGVGATARKWMAAWTGAGKS